MDEEPIPDPIKEIEKNIEFISPVKRCPRCGKLSLEFDINTGRIFCVGCGFEKYMKR